MKGETKFEDSISQFLGKMLKEKVVSLTLAFLEASYSQKCLLIFFKSNFLPIGPEGCLTFRELYNQIKSSQSCMLEPNLKLFNGFKEPNYNCITSS